MIIRQIQLPIIDFYTEIELCSSRTIDSHLDAAIWMVNRSLLLHTASRDCCGGDGGGGSEGGGGGGGGDGATAAVAIVLTPSDLTRFRLR